MPHKKDYFQVRVGKIWISKKYLTISGARKAEVEAYKEFSPDLKNNPLIQVLKNGKPIKE